VIVNGKAVIGIDPGLSGAICLLDGLNRVTIWDMPTVEVLRGRKTKRELDLTALSTIIFGITDEAVAYVEQVGAMPGQGVSSMFSFGKSYGGTLGILAALQVPVQEHVPPQRWQKALNVRKGKDGSRLRASELLPSYMSLWARVKDDGRAEAALIAYYGMHARA